MSTLEVIQGDVNLRVTGLEQARVGLAELRQASREELGGMSDDALRAAVAQDKLDKAIARHGPASTAAKSATLAYRREMAALAGQSAATDIEVRKLDGDVGRLGRGALTGTGLLHGLGRAAAFSSTAFLGGAGLVYAVREFVKVSQQQQANEAQLAAALKAQGINYAEYKHRIDESLNSLELLSGFTESDTIPAFTKLVRTTGNVEQGLLRTHLAAEIARGSGISLASAANIVNKALAGSTTGLRRLGIELPKGVTGYQGLEIASKRFAGSLQANADTAAGAQERLGIAIHQTEVTIGDGLTPTVQKLETHLTDWLGNSRNQERIQRDVNAAVKDGTAIVHGLVDAEQLIAPPIHAAIGALGGLEHAVEIALVVGLVAKARKGAIALDGILTASGLARTKIVEDSATEEAALAGVQAQAERTAAAVGSIGAASAAGAAETAAAGGVAAAGGAAGAAGGISSTAVGGFVGGALAKGGKLLLRGGEIYLVYKGLEFALGSSPPTSATGPNRYQGSNLVQDWENFASDAVTHPGSFFKNIGEGLLNDADLAHYSSSGTSGGVKTAPPLTWQDLYPAIQAGALTVSGINQLHNAGRIPDAATYRGAIALAQQVALNANRVSVPAGAGGTVVTGTGLLSPLDRARAAMQSAALTPSSADDFAALNTEAALLRKNVTTEKARLARATTPKQAAAFNANLQGLEGDLESVLSQIDQITAANASERKAARAAAAQAAAAALTAERRKLGAAFTGASGSYKVDLSKVTSLIQRVKLPANIGGSYAFGGGFEVPFSIQLKEALAATTASEKDDIAAAKALEAYAEAAIKSHKLRGQALLDAINTLAQAKSTLGQLTPPPAAAAAAANESEFLSSFLDVITKFGGNTTDIGAPGILSTHGHNTVNELRRTNKQLGTIAKQSRFAGTYGAKVALLGAYG